MLSSLATQPGKALPLVIIELQKDIRSAAVDLLSHTPREEETTWFFPNEPEAPSSNFPPSSSQVVASPEACNYTLTHLAG